MAPSSRQVTERDIIYSLGWAPRETSRLKAWLDNAVEGFFAQFEAMIPRKEGTRIRGPNQKAVIDTAALALRSAGIARKYEQQFNTKDWTLLDKYAWFVWNMVKVERAEGGIWENKAREDIEDCCEIAHLVLRYLRKFSNKAVANTTAPRNNQPDNADEDERSLTLISQKSIEILEKEPDPETKANMLRRMYAKMVLRRSYATIVEGKKIGDKIPPLKQTLVVLESQGDMKEKMEKVMTANLRKFWRCGPNLLPVRDAKFVRHLAGKLGFNPSTLAQTKGIDSVFSAVALQTTKLRYASFLVTHIVMFLETKVVIWVEYPHQQLLLELFFSALGLRTESLHATLPDKQRHALVDNFNTTEDISASIVTYPTCSVGLNIQEKCYFNIIFEPAVLIQVQNQVIYRIIRISQSNPQYTIVLKESGSYNDWQSQNQKVKRLIELGARISKEGKAQWDALLDAQDFPWTDRMGMLWDLALGKKLDIKILGRTITTPSRRHFLRKSIGGGRERVDDLSSPRQKKPRLEHLSKVNYLTKFCAAYAKGENPVVDPITAIQFNATMAILTLMQIDVPGFAKDHEYDGLIGHLLPEKRAEITSDFDQNVMSARTVEQCFKQEPESLSAFHTELSARLQMS
ncbi:hypothetical protein BTUL_0033g00290 [Botrytis tulipae]|uniref:Helicase C-terminal domain-containing protein n=1 Tax=Botrytis tulipae TaxID=87230 RepID=A0A4Z1F3E3_9HELO|nr:hypothetical protein BTUL_0033g00290 [Botrytis tulipae]